MKIRYTNWRRTVEVADVKDYVARQLTDTHADGTVERIGDVARQSAEAVGRLVELLADRGLLSAQDIVHLADDYVRDGVLELIPEPEDR